jgi:hypothetical protein
MADIRLIRTEDDYEQALQEIASLMIEQNARLAHPWGAETQNSGTDALSLSVQCLNCVYHRLICVSSRFNRPNPQFHATNPHFSLI